MIARIRMIIRIHQYPNPVSSVIGGVIGPTGGLGSIGL
jgi:hypothetical protein